MSDFSEWLGAKLRALNTDDGVFGSYIQGILDGDETSDEKIDALEGILSEIVESDISAICKEIMDKWESMQAKAKAQSVNQGAGENVDDKLVRLLESQTLSTVVQREYTVEERRLKDAILSQYGQMTDDEGEEEESGTVSKAVVKEEGSSTGGGLKPNTNALLVQQAEKEKREQAKLDAQKKKDKDKEDREKQKQMREEKKEKRKTQKGERKR